MSKIRVNRHNHYINWKLPDSFEDSPYPAEAALIERLRTKPSAAFHPFQFAYTESPRYHYYLAFLIEAVELFPLHMDLGYDAIWRAFEAVCRDDYVLTIGKSLKQFTPTFATTIASQHPYQTILADTLAAIPVQSCEYLVSRLYSDWPPDSNDEKDSTLIMKRLRFGPGNPPVTQFPSLVNFLHGVAGKYGAPSITLDSKRRAATLLKLALSGRLVTVATDSFQLSVAERISFLIGALLYTFRNDRFHANVQPPFKSSKGTLQTYAHVHYCFITGHLLLLLALAEAGIISAKATDICSNAVDNLNAFLSFYGRHLKK